jgi:monovalent cation:H+ antiporter-2, CPA2 family
VFVAMPGLALLEIGAVLLGAALAGALIRRLGLPAVLGYLAVGLAIGPFTPGYVADRDQIEFLADVGVALLLFEVGIELDFNELRREPPGILVAVPLQVVATLVLAALAFGATGAPPLGAVTLGLAVALSSSVVIVNITRSRRRTLDERTARALIVWAILQDVVTLVAVAFLGPLLLAEGAIAIALAIGRLLLFSAVAAAIHGLVVPRLLRATRAEPDTFLVIAVSVALTTAGIVSVVFGVPVALAAFVAGLALSGRPEAAEARREVLPFRDLFAVLFFVAIGTLVDPGAVAAQPWLLAIVVLLVAGKSAISAVLAALFRVPSRPAQLGVGLGQIGEFSFVVLGLGTMAGVVSSEHFSVTLAAAAITIGASAIGARLFPRQAQPASTLPIS